LPALCTFIYHGPARGAIRPNRFDTEPMIYALDESGEMMRATPEANGRCPHCKAEVIPKCGEVKTWHWAHRDVEDCDRWGEPETKWHQFWKERVPSARAEVTIERGGEQHRAEYNPVRQNRGRAPTQFPITGKDLGAGSLSF
jgi:hypothetical protein